MMVETKIDALKELAAQAFEKKKLDHPSMPEFAIVKTKFNDSTSNDLTKCILAYFRMNGGYAVRINTQGQWNEKLGMFTKSTTKKGTSDVHGCLNGRFYSIEVKIGRDSQSDEQEETQVYVEASGGLYFVAKNYQSFYEWISIKRKDVEYAS